MFWFLLIWWHLASYLWLGHSEVVTSFASCPQFFYKNTPPGNALNPQNPASICQRYNNQHHFATLYDRTLRIPVYSAYIYRPGPGKRPQPQWFVEPQLINSTTYSGDMEEEKNFVAKNRHIIQALKQSQAVLNDCKNMIGLIHGLLNPSGHHNTYISKQATYTLTNTVPQDVKFYCGPWKTYEVKTMNQKTKGCTTTYIITGAVPSNSQSPKPRVNTPSHIWSAACCPAENKAWGVVAENDSKSQVQILTLGDVENRLATLYGKGKVSLFHPDCPRQ